MFVDFLRFEFNLVIYVEVDAESERGSEINVEQRLAPSRQVNIVLGQLDGGVLSDEPNQKVS